MPSIDANRSQQHLARFLHGHEHLARFLHGHEHLARFLHGHEHLARFLHGHEHLARFLLVLNWHAYCLAMELARLLLEPDS